jgi:hypothetical protein
LDPLIGVVDAGGQDGLERALSRAVHTNSSVRSRPRYQPRMARVKMSISTAKYRNSERRRI